MITHWDIISSIRSTDNAILYTLLIDGTEHDARLIAKKLDGYVHAPKPASAPYVYRFALPDDLDEDTLEKIRVAVREGIEQAKKVNEFIPGGALGNPLFNSETDKEDKDFPTFLTLDPSESFFRSSASPDLQIAPQQPVDIEGWEQKQINLNEPEEEIPQMAKTLEEIGEAAPLPPEDKKENTITVSSASLTKRKLKKKKTFISFKKKAADPAEPQSQELPAAPAAPAANTLPPVTEPEQPALSNVEEEPVENEVLTSLENKDGWSDEIPPSVQSSEEQTEDKSLHLQVQAVQAEKLPTALNPLPQHPEQEPAKDKADNDLPLSDRDMLIKDMEGTMLGQSIDDILLAETKYDMFLDLDKLEPAKQNAPAAKPAEKPSPAAQAQEKEQPQQPAGAFAFAPAEEKGNDSFNIFDQKIKDQTNFIDLEDIKAVTERITQKDLSFLQHANMPKKKAAEAKPKKEESINPEDDLNKTRAYMPMPSSFGRMDLSADDSQEVMDPFEQMLAASANTKKEAPAPKEQETQPQDMPAPQNLPEADTAPEQAPSADAAEQAPQQAEPLPEETPAQASAEPEMQQPPEAQPPQAEETPEAVGVELPQTEEQPQAEKAQLPQMEELQPLQEELPAASVQEELTDPITQPSTPEEPLPQEAVSPDNAAESLQQETPAIHSNEEEPQREVVPPSIPVTEKKMPENNGEKKPILHIKRKLQPEPAAAQNTKPVPPPVPAAPATPAVPAAPATPTAPANASAPLPQEEKHGTTILRRRRPAGTFLEKTRTIDHSIELPLSELKKHNWPLEVPLIPTYTLENMTISVNRFAHATAISVIDNPGKLYNPLVLHGASGTGKTHFLHAIGYALSNKYGQENIFITNGVRLSRGIQRYVMEGNIDKFESFVDSVKALLIDDIHLIAINEQNRVYLSKLLNDFRKQQKQIVITSKYPPESLAKLEELLNFRLDSGWISDLKPATGNARTRIIQKMLTSNGIDITNDDINRFFGHPNMSLGTVSRSIRRVRVLEKLIFPHEEQANRSTTAIFDQLLATAGEDQHSLIMKKSPDEINSAPVSGNGEWGRIGFFYPQNHSNMMNWLVFAMQQRAKELGISGGPELAVRSSYSTENIISSAFKIANLCDNKKLKGAVILGPETDTCDPSVRENFYDILTHMLEIMLIRCGVINYEDVNAPSTYVKILSELLR